MSVSTRAAVPTADEMLRRGFDGFDGKTLEQKVQELADREEIRELIARYAQRVTRGMSPADMFTDDGAFIVHNMGVPVRKSQGRAQLEKEYAEIVSRPEPYFPKIHNHVISISGDEAIGLCWIEIQIKGRSDIGSGYYEDRFRRENGRWKFAVRESTMVDWQSGAPGAAQKGQIAP